MYTLAWQTGHEGAGRAHQCTAIPNHMMPNHMMRHVRGPARPLQEACTLFLFVCSDGSTWQDPRFGQISQLTTITVQNSSVRHACSTAEQQAQWARLPIPS